MLCQRSAAPLAITLVLLIGLALESASCGQTCPGLQSCGDSSANTDGSGDAGGGNTSCEQLVALRACLDNFCQPADKNPFCTCYKRGFDLGRDCKCVKFEAARYCEEAGNNRIDAAALDCSASTSSVASLCVDVR